MILPIYASLERVDPRLIEAAKDLYASSRAAFVKVTLPLSAPGVVAGTLLTFIPASGDYVNAFFLGGPNNTMIGNVIQGLYLNTRDYPAAAALSFVLMAVIMVVVFVYIRFAGLGGADGRGGGTGLMEARLQRPHVRAPRIGAATGVGVAQEARAQHLRGLRDRVPADPDRGHHRRSPSTTRRASTTSPGRGSRSSTGRTPSASRTSTTRWSRASSSRSSRRSSPRSSAR